ncbi:RING-H2 zinc finger protein RHA1a [Morus notabilis]|uniref:RING-H2 zinc finger protein RHA1a n=1 Tax=Morus notabilis TaxID=981085 RepID=W9QH20_9ROSA|nr:probable E3 ubiquitin-protein ligase RHA1A [Morus notabilis]EXB37315.1 RING-H2 zinc finger protein RHA1a [Morus notabilis]
MGFPVGYTELFLPKLFIHLLSLLGFLRKFISIIFSFLGLQDFLDPESSTSWSSTDSPATTRIPEFHSVSSVLIRELLPVVKFSELVDPPESCAVCLYEFESEDEIRRLTNCCHIFHRSCLDRWMGYDQKTCPLCRTPLLRDDLQGAINERLWAASGIPEFYAEYSHITGL